MTWSDICLLAEVPEGRGHYVIHGGRGLAVYRVDGGVRVLDDACPHAGGSLSAGKLSKDDGGACVVCPWHEWTFDAETGKCPDNAAWGVKVYEARVVEGRVQIQV